MTRYAYISGPVSGFPDFQKKFKDCELWIAENTYYYVLNPVELNPSKLYHDGIYDPGYNDYMRASFYHLCMYPNIDMVMLSDYNKSNGACEEFAFARKRNMKIMYFTHDNFKHHLIGIDKDMIRKDNKNE